MLSIAQIWLILAIILIVAEVMTLTFFLLWPAIAALILAVLTWIIPEISLFWQLVIFAGLTAILTLPGRRLIGDRFLKSDRPTLNTRGAAMIGKTGTIASGSTGNYRLALGDGEWTAKSEQALKKGDVVTITAVDGTVLTVKKA